MEIEQVCNSEALPLLSLNHVSLLCRSVPDSVRFYEDVLGFVSIKRPSSFNFNGACAPLNASSTIAKINNMIELHERRHMRQLSPSLADKVFSAGKKIHLFLPFRLYNYGIGIHLIENPSLDEFEPPSEPRPINPKDNHISFQCSDVGLVKGRLEEMGMRFITAVVQEGEAKVDQFFFHDPDGYMIELCNCENIPIMPLSSCPLKPKLLGGFHKITPENCGFMENVMMENLSMDMMNFAF